MILGESGSGKSTSLQNFKPGDVCVLNVAGKRLPFRNSFGKNIVDLQSRSDRYALIVRAVQSGNYKRYVVDDSQYLLAFDAFDRAKETGYGKFTDMALNFYNVLMACKRARNNATGGSTDDVIVYFLHHTDRDDSGLIKPKTQGRMLDEKLNIAGLFTIILLAGTDGNEYWFETQNDGHSVAKSPMGMFAEKRIPNDLALVDKTIREYYEMEA